MVTYEGCMRSKNELSHVTELRGFRSGFWVEVWIKDIRWLLLMRRMMNRGG